MATHQLRQLQQKINARSVPKADNGAIPTGNAIQTTNGRLIIDQPAFSAVGPAAFMQQNCGKTDSGTEFAPSTDPTDNIASSASGWFPEQDLQLSPDPLHEGETL